jgi:thioredoxin reductase (NADPH)
VELSQAAAKVYIVYRGVQLRGDPIWLEQVEKNQKIEVIYNTVMTEIMGDGEKVTGVKLSSYQVIKQLSGESSIATSLNSSIAKILSLDKIFIEIGGVPGTALVIPLGVEMDPGGYIIVNDRLATNVAGIFAAGDLVSYGLSIEQISSAVGLGARAAASVFAFLKQEKAPTAWGESQIKRS